MLSGAFQYVFEKVLQSEDSLIEEHLRVKIRCSILKMDETFGF